MKRKAWHGDRRKAGRITPMIFYTLEVFATLLVVSIIYAFNIGLFTVLAMASGVAYLTIYALPRLLDRLGRDPDDG